MLPLGTAPASCSVARPSSIGGGDRALSSTRSTTPSTRTSIFSGGPNGRDSSSGTHRRYASTMPWRDRSAGTTGSQHRPLEVQRRVMANYRVTVWKNARGLVDWSGWPAGELQYLAQVVVVRRVGGRPSLRRGRGRRRSQRSGRYAGGGDGSGLRSADRDRGFPADRSWRRCRTPGPGSAPTGQTWSPVRVVEQPEDPFRQGARVRDGNHQPGDAVLDRFSHASGVGGDHWHPSSHGLDDDPRQPFPHGREGEYVEPRQQGRPRRSVTLGG